ncbi:hypothetical protein PBY51_011049 [Eleginops maclovinus]|uniref:Uncharacterized protein n=1 Tax=Eleginops maclovinus TaxID=56733 RepID=A0AAN8AK43_ELEMC|nr:hypothetical protein PBY51_011049 [Eleginops maclovinus]
MRCAFGHLSKKAGAVTSPKRPNLKSGTWSIGEGMKGNINAKHRIGEVFGGISRRNKRRVNVTSAYRVTFTRHGSCFSASIDSLQQQKRGAEGGADNRIKSPNLQHIFSFDRHLERVTGL